MSRVEVDKVKKLIKFKMTGFFKPEDVESLTSELEKVFKEFKPKEAVALGIMSGFKPVSANITPALEKFQSFVASSSKKVATVHDNVVAEMQGKRIGQDTKANDTIKRFHSEEEALKYLFS